MSSPFLQCQYLVHFKRLDYFDVALAYKLINRSNVTHCIRFLKRNIFKMTQKFECATLLVHYYNKFTGVLYEGHDRGSKGGTGIAKPCSRRGDANTLSLYLCNLPVCRNEFERYII